MSAKVRNLSPQVLSVLVGVAGLLVLLAGVYFLVLPQRHKAAHLSTELVKTQTEIVTARALATQRPEERIRVADLFKVVQAMPDDTDMTGVILQLQQTATEAGVKFESIQPQALEAGAGYGVEPIDLAFTGNYYSLTDFLYRLRKLVGVHHGTLDATGRLFSVGRIDFAPGANGFPSIAAIVRVNAYVYSPATVGATTVPPLPTDTTQTTTTAATGATAIGATR
jgi:type IV pilus assembly protein PilO